MESMLSKKEEAAHFFIGYLQTAIEDIKISKEIRIFAVDLIALGYGIYPELHIIDDKELPDVTKLPVYLI